MSDHQSPHTANDCDSVRALIPEYAFGLSDAAETHLVETNLSTCPDAASDLEAFRQIQADMRAGVAQIEPAPQLRERLMAAVEKPLQNVQEHAVPIRRRLRIHRAWLI